MLDGIKLNRVQSRFDKMIALPKHTLYTHAVSQQINPKFSDAKSGKDLSKRKFLHQI